MNRLAMITCLLLLRVPCLPAFAEPTPGAIPEVLRYLDNGGVAVTHAGKALYGHRAGERFAPASTLKVVTALAAIHHLGLSYRFKTEVYQSPEGDLTLRGYGDPFLVSEEWQLLVDGLIASEALRQPIRHLYLDTSAFDPEIEIPGLSGTLNPYDAVGGALAANFNTIHVMVGADGTVRSGEEQTPLTQVARGLAKKRAPGKHRFNISHQAEVPVRYAGELAAAFLARAGYAVNGQIAHRVVSARQVPIYTHLNSRTLGEVVAAMMQYSNNLVANQILLTLGLEKGGEPATLARGVGYLERYLSDELGIDAAEFTLVEGSGISRQNRITPAALARVLSAFYPHRNLLTPQNGVPLKTGTLTGVYALAGFLPSDHPLVFVILLNQPRNTRNEVLGVLRRETERRFESQIALGSPN